MREVILRGVGLGVATLPSGEKALAFAEHDRSEVVLVPMSDENFRTLAAQWTGLVVANAMPRAPAMATSVKSRKNGGH